MKILITSDCTKKSLKSTRQILDSFGYRISKKTWLLSITNEGLQNIIKLLKNKARKNNSISIYNAKDFKQIAFIGNKNKFDKQGQCMAISNKKIITSELKFEKIIKAAGNLHDIGKANSEFQEILRNDNTCCEKNFLRHDILSVIYIDFLESDLDKTKDNFKAFLIEYILSEQNIITKDITSLNLLKLLILTHHKTPLFDKDRGYEEDGLESFYAFNETYHNLKKSIEFLNLDEYFLLDSQLINESMKSLVDIKNIKITKNEFTYMLNIGRFALISGDHFSSAHENFYQEKETKDYFSNKLLAKSIDTKREGFSKTTYRTQTLLSHLKNVGNESLKYLKTFENIELPGLKKEQTIELLSDTKNIRFDWQNISMKFIKDNFKQDNNNICFVSSSTGSGKTKFSARLAIEMSKDNRITTTLGLRSLTLQTGKAYQEITGLESSVLIGSKPVKEIFDIENNIEETESTDELVTLDNISTLSKLKPHEDFLINKSPGFHLSPVLVCTIDYLIKAANHTNSHFLNSFLRLKTSDLIIDEVDNYDLNDIKVIGKLLYLAGMFKRNVIISTATPSIEIIRFLQDMYTCGSKVNNKKVDTYLLSDTKGISSFINIKINDLDNDMLLYTQYLRNIDKYKLEIRDVTMDNIHAHVTELHLNNSEKGLKNQNLSIGLIRVANIKSGYKLYEKLKDEFDVIFYHSQIPLLYKSYIENLLDNTLNRKDGLTLDTKPLFKLFDDSDRTIVVIATPLEEVGRDHDFNWVIIEPSSTRSIIQTLGRLLRHRNMENEKTNAILMNENFKLQYAAPNKDTCVFIYPGFEKESFGINSEKSMKKIANYLEDGINQRYAILAKTDEEFSFKEQQVIKKELLSYNDIFKNIEKNPFISLFGNKHHPEYDILHHIRFRDGAKTTLFYFENERIKYLNEFKKIDILTSASYAKYNLQNTDIYTKIINSFADYKSQFTNENLFFYEVALVLRNTTDKIHIFDNLFLGVFSDSQFLN